MSKNCSPAEVVPLAGLGSGLAGNVWAVHAQYYSPFAYVYAAYVETTNS